MRHSRLSVMPMKRAAASTGISRTRTRAACSNRSVNRLSGRAHGTAFRDHIEVQLVRPFLDVQTLPRKLPGCPQAKPEREHISRFHRCPHAVIQPACKAPPQRSTQRRFHFKRRGSRFTPAALKFAADRLYTPTLRKPERPLAKGFG